MLRAFVVALILCAGLPAQLVFAAVPVEESVEESAEAAASTNPSVRPRDRVRGLDIPPTIEPRAAGTAADTTSSGAYPRTIEPAPVQDGSAAASGAGQLSQLFYQLQVLEQEVQALRGQVEEQDYLIKRLQQEQKEQYLDLDKRVVALVENRPAPGPSVSQPATTTTPTAGSGNTMTERGAYTAAFDAMRNRQFEQSMAGFQQLINDYPNGQYTPNAYYWIGELHLAANGDPELARQAFVQVVSLYPDHQKAPDALYKLGVVYHTLGDTETAKKYLQEVQNQHPNSSAASLAAKFAAEL